MPNEMRCLDGPVGPGARLFGRGCPPKERRIAVLADGIVEIWRHRADSEWANPYGGMKRTSVWRLELKAPRPELAEMLRSLCAARSDLGSWSHSLADGRTATCDRDGIVLRRRVKTAVYPVPDGRIAFREMRRLLVLLRDGGEERDWSWGP